MSKGTKHTKTFEILPATPFDISELAPILHECFWAGYRDVPVDKLIVSHMIRLINKSDDPFIEIFKVVDKSNDEIVGFSMFKFPGKGEPARSGLSLRPRGRSLLAKGEISLVLPPEKLARLQSLSHDENSHEDGSDEKDNEDEEEDNKEEDEDNDEHLEACYYSPESAISNGTPTRGQKVLVSRALHPARRRSKRPYRKNMVIQKAKEVVAHSPLPPKPPNPTGSHCLSEWQRERIHQSLGTNKTPMAEPLDKEDDGFDADTEDLINEDDDEEKEDNDDDCEDDGESDDEDDDGESDDDEGYAEVRSIWDAINRCYNKDVDFWVEYVAVTPCYRRLGLGARLLQAGLNLVDERRGKVCVSASPIGIPLYLKLGFKVAEEIDGETYMVRELEGKSEEPCSAICDTSKDGEK